GGETKRDHSRPVASSPARPHQGVTLQKTSFAISDACGREGSSIDQRIENHALRDRHDVVVIVIVSSSSRTVIAIADYVLVTVVVSGFSRTVITIKWVLTPYRWTRSDHLASPVLDLPIARALTSNRSPRLEHVP